MRRPSEGLPSPGQRFEILFDRHCDEVRRFAVRRIGADRADDVVSATFLVAWRRLDEIPATHEIEWLYTTARNVIRTELRAEGRRDRLAERLIHQPASADADLADAIAERDFVLAALQRQSPADQEVLRLAAWEALSPEAAARALGCSRTAYKVRLHRARKRLAKSLEPNPGTKRAPGLAEKQITRGAQS